MQGRPAVGGGFKRQGRAHGRVSLGHVVQAVEQGFEVQHGAADQQRQFAARANVFNQLLCVLYKFSSAVSFERVANVNQVMFDRGQLGGARLGRANVHAPVHQRRIDADDFDRVMPGNGQCGSRFAGCRRACQCDKRPVRMGHVAQRRKRNRHAGKATRKADAPAGVVLQFSCAGSGATLGVGRQ